MTNQNIERIETIESDSKRELDILVNKKLEEGFVILDDLKVIPSSYAATAIGYEVRGLKFYRTIAKIKKD